MVWIKCNKNQSSYLFSSFIRLLSFNDYYRGCNSKSKLNGEKEPFCACGYMLESNTICT